MKLIPTSRFSARRLASAVTVLELMVAISMLSIIILGLYSMFDRTQKSFQSSTTQVDVLEQGRAVMEILTRELEQMVALNQTNSTNIYANLMLNKGIAEFTQSRPNGTTFFTNTMQEVFFYNRQTNWRAIAYLVAESSSSLLDRQLYTNGIGTLTRLEINTNLNRLKGNEFLDTYLTNGSYVITNRQRLADGVTHFYIRAYDTDGTLVNTNFTGFYYTNNILPAYLEIELGLIEPRAMQEIRSIANTNIQKAFLEDTNFTRSSRIHLFVQRIPIRNQ